MLTNFFDYSLIVKLVMKRNVDINLQLVLSLWFDVTRLINRQFHAMCVLIIFAITYSLCCNYIFQNMRVMSKYYTRIRMSRMAELLDLTEDVSSFLQWLMWFGTFCICCTFW